MSLLLFYQTVSGNKLIAADTVAYTITSSAATLKYGRKLLAQTQADKLIGAETDGLAISFMDGSMVIRDTTTPANNFNGLYTNKLTITGAIAPSLADGAFFDASNYATLATSLMPSLGSAVTIYAEYLIPTVSSLSTYGALTINDGTNNERFTLTAALVTSSKPAAVVVDGGATQANVTAAFDAYVQGTIGKVALAAELNNTTGAYNGTNGGTDATCTMPTVTTIRFGQLNAAAAPLDGYLRRVLIVPRRMSDADVNALTAFTGQEADYYFTSTAATLRVGKVMAAASASYAITSSAVTLKFGRKLAAASASYAISSTAATLTYGKRIAAASASYAITSTAASFVVAHKIVAASASYSISSTAATLRRGIPLVAGSASYSISLTAATLLHGWKVAAASATFTISSTAATLTVGRKLAAASASYAITSGAASLLYGREVVAGSVSYAISSTAATLRQGRLIAAGSSAFSISSSTASLLYGRKLALGTTSYVITSTDVGLNWSGATKILVAGSASYAITSNDATLLCGRLAAVDTTAYAIGAGAATLTYARKMVAGSTAYAFTPSEADLLLTAVIAASRVNVPVYVNSRKSPSGQPYIFKGRSR
jgi:hypothetical protein